MFNRLRIGESTLQRIIHIFLSLYLFLLIFPHTTTLREIAFWITFLCWLWLRFKTHRPFLVINKVTIFLFIFILIAFISSVIGIEPLENLKRFKGEIAIPFILFLVIASEYKDKEKALSLLLAPAIAFAIYTIYVIINYTIDYEFTTFLHKKLRDIKIFDGYPQRSITLFPITIGIFLCGHNRLKYLLLVAAILEFIIIGAYDSFTPFLSAISVLVICALFAQPKMLRNGMRIVMVGFVILFSVLILLKEDIPSLKHHKERLNKIIHFQNELKTEKGFSDRILIWKASIDVIKERPLLGYGSGMKKYQYITHWDKFLNKWKKDNPRAYRVFLIYKNVFLPPHNLFLEVAFQFGILGLSIFCTFLFLYSFQLIRIAISSNDFNFFLILIGGTLLSFMIMGLMNNELGNMSGKLFFAILGVGAAWINNKS
jgi:O-antigen ligase